MALDTTTRWIVTAEHLAAMNTAAGAAIAAARQHHDRVTLEAVRTLMAAYELLLLQWGTERGMALGDVSHPDWRPPGVPDDTP